MSSAVRVHRLSSPLGDWELALGEPSAALRPYIQGMYTGSTERLPGTLTRLEVPHPGVVCIFNFGTPYRVTDPRDGRSGEWLGSFVAGLYDSYVHVDARGTSQCVQCNLTPLGALRLLGLPLEHVTNQSVPMHDVLGAVGRDLAERMGATDSWEGRFALLEEAWRARLSRAPGVPPLVQEAWHALARTHGNVEVARIAHAIGCSRKRLTTQFRTHVGLPPKALARILRFHRVIECLVASEGRRLSEIAHACGYYDHAHLDRDFRDLAGLSPSTYFAMRHPTFGAVVTASNAH
ncbi:MAG: AraC family transcriptional regulator [Gemmatimonadetes bacterium]|nr:AraC family transcriptional regulator [Gemmatimonadota bacterium]